MDDCLSPHAEFTCAAVCVKIPAEQHRLKEHHAGVPDAWRSAKERQQQFPDQGLDEEQQRSPNEQGESVQSGKQSQPHPNVGKSTWSDCSHILTVEGTTRRISAGEIYLF